MLFQNNERFVQKSLRISHIVSYQSDEFKLWSVLCLVVYKVFFISWITLPVAF